MPFFPLDGHIQEKNMKQEIFDTRWNGGKARHHHAGLRPDEPLFRDQDYRDQEFAGQVRPGPLFVDRVVREQVPGRTEIRRPVFRDQVIGEHHLAVAGEEEAACAE